MSNKDKHQNLTLRR